MKVIFHADDFGFDNDTTAATIKLFENGCLTSATIMATTPLADEAIAYAAKHPEHSFGVHMTYVDGLRPALKKEGSTLLDSNGLFYPSNDIRKKAMKLSLNRNDIIEESLAQIEKVRKGGVKISHLDSHGHLHKFPSFLLALSEIKKRSGINRVRRVQNIFINPQHISPTLILNRCFDAYISRTCCTTDFFYMSANNMDIGWADDILAQMDELPQNAIIEIGVHPGHIEKWRQHEYEDIIEFATKLIANDRHQIINWNQL